MRLHMSLAVLATVATLASSQLSFGGGGSTTSTTASPNGSVAGRLGLLADSLGIEPVPLGSLPEDTKAYTENIPGNYGGSIPQSPYTAPAPPGNCKCTPKDYCNGNNNGGGGQGGNYNGGGGQGGNYNGGGGQGGNYNGGGGQGGKYPDNGPIGGGGQGGKYPDNGQIGGGGQGGKYPDSGLIEGGGQGGSNPETDGSGVIDIRIVNRQCPNGEIFCCARNDGGNGGNGGNGGIIPISPNSCGVNRIIHVPGHVPEHGQADFGEYPWMAVILGKGNNYVGAGALLNSYYVLTAAHKVAEFRKNFDVRHGYTNLKVRLGEWNAQDDSEPNKNVEIEIESIEIHPAFNSQNLQNDVAIVKLAQPINLETFPHIKSVCLPTNGASFYGQRCWVAGFGKDAFQTGKHSYLMREVDVPIVESNECEQRLRGTRLGSYFNLNRKSFICAGGEEGKDACTGDGGAPLVCQQNGYFNVVGLVAWGIGCADQGVPGVYVNVGNYVNWIQEQINGNGNGNGNY